MKKTKLFGVTMGKGTKIRIVTCMVLAILCIIFYVVLTFFEKPVEVVLEYPDSGLTQSIFDSQNLVYEKVDEYTLTNCFINVPYSVEVPNGRGASVGNASIYYHDPFYFYCSEMKIGGNVAEVVASEVTDVLLLSADSKDTTIEILDEQVGYINGCAATYYLLNVSVAKDEKVVSADMVLYRLLFDESIYDSEYELLIGCMASRARTTENLYALQSLAKASVGTLKGVSK